MDLATVTRETFEPLCGQTFRVSVGGQAMTMELAEVSALPTRAGQVRAPFALVFIAPAGEPVEQATFRLEHGSLGAFDLFMVPIGERDGALRLEAIFN